jgi:hypothetical protein
MQGVNYRGYMIQPLRRGEDIFVVNIFPLGDIHPGSQQGARPRGHDQLIKLTEARSGMYQRFADPAAAMRAGEKKVDALLRAPSTKRPARQG